MTAINRIDTRKRTGIGGWLLVLCVLLLAWRPVGLAVTAAGALDALAVRGVALVLILLVRLLATAAGVAAGLALVRRRPGAVWLARWSLVLSAVVDVFVYTTPYFPSNRPPGTTPLVVTASLLYHGGWVAYLFRSKRVRHTFPS